MSRIFTTVPNLLSTGFLYWLGYVIGVISLMAMSSAVFPPMGLIILILLALAGFGVV